MTLARPLVYSWTPKGKAAASANMKCSSRNLLALFWNAALLLSLLVLTLKAELQSTDTQTPKGDPVLGERIARGLVFDETNSRPSPEADRNRAGDCTADLLRDQRGDGPPHLRCRKCGFHNRSRIYRASSCRSPCCGVARRAIRIDPMVSLRYEQHRSLARLADALLEPGE